MKIGSVCRGQSKQSPGCVVFAVMYDCDHHVNDDPEHWQAKADDSTDHMLVSGTMMISQRYAKVPKS